MLRRVVTINERSALLIPIILALLQFQITDTANGHKSFTKSEDLKTSQKSIPDYKVQIKVPITKTVDVSSCIDPKLECSDLNFPCISCNYNASCVYGQALNVTCEVAESIQCAGERKFNRSMTCQYCFQTQNPADYQCEQRGNCMPSKDVVYRTNCTVNADVLCLGNRSYHKKIPCNWTYGYRWSTALLISITLGGFGADRFYLGFWQEGIGKLFSFGGLGVWTVIDCLLISLHYLGPADGSLYI